MSPAMCRNTILLGGLAMIPRYITTDDRHQFYSNLPNFFRSDSLLGISVGVDHVEIGSIMEELGNFYYPNEMCLVIDVAHGHHVKVVEAIGFIKKLNPQLKVIAGNVATYEGYKFLVDAGADMVKVGIGGGSVCETKSVTGVHIPTAASIYDIQTRRGDCSVPIIADGGIRSSGDMVKALVLGADMVCCGRLFAGTDLVPEWVRVNSNEFIYEGMSSHEHRKRHHVDKPGIASEGKSITVTPGKSTGETYQELLGGIRTGLSYLGLESLDALIKQRSDILNLNVTINSL